MTAGLHRGNNVRLEFEHVLTPLTHPAEAWWYARSR